MAQRFKVTNEIHGIRAIDIDDKTHTMIDIPKDSILVVRNSKNTPFGFTYICQINLGDKRYMVDILSEDVGKDVQIFNGGRRQRYRSTTTVKRRKTKKTRRRSH